MKRQYGFWTRAMRGFLTTAVCLLLSAGATTAASPPLATAEELLDQAADELRNCGDQIDFELLLRIAQAQARFDRESAIDLLSRAFEMAQAETDTLHSLRDIELVAMYASPIDDALCTKALRWIRRNVPERALEEPYIRRKMLAVNMAVAHVDGPPGFLEDLVGQAEAFCRNSESIWKHDVGTSSRVALAEYLAMLNPRLAAGFWPTNGDLRAWRRRLDIASNLVYHRSAVALDEINDLIRTAPNAQEKVAAIVALYDVGKEEEAISQAISLLEEIGPTEIGEGWPLGDLVGHVAAKDPEGAKRIALLASSEHDRRAALGLVIRGAAKDHPEAVFELAQRMENDYWKDYVRQQAAISHAKRGDTKSALEVAEGIRRKELKNSVLLAIARVEREPKQFEEVLRLAWEKAEHPGNLWPITAAAMRALGVKDTIRLIERTRPKRVVPSYHDKICAALALTARYDPAWSLEVFKEPQTTTSVPSHPLQSVLVRSLLPWLARVDPQFVAQYIEEYAAEEERCDLRNLISQCLRGMAWRSGSEAEALSRRLGRLIDNPEPVSPDSIQEEHQVAQIVAAGKNVNQVLADMNRSHKELRSLLQRALAHHLRWPIPDTVAALELAASLEDKDFADEAFGALALSAHSRGQEQERRNLMEKISSPGQRARALWDMARRELDPKPMNRRPFLAGWFLPERRRSALRR